MTTKALSSASPEVENWHELHRAAMRETERKELPFRINEAEKALARRSRELFALPREHPEERKELDHALYKLRALSF
ncbi:MAG TPA: hypothetical protein VFE61_30805 [Candidatus Sulfotelmatobacter sp.]|nr:hypothetical protein [Candidatus Sulfotelmatobacter sp.]